MRTILFVCSGNTCRSPMAEAIARHSIDDGLLGDAPDVFVASAGVAAPNGSPPTVEAMAALAAIGIEYEGSSKPLTAEMIRNADLVLCMTSRHVETARSLAPTAHESQIMRLDPAGNIEDPIGMAQAGYDSLADRLMQIIPQRLKELLGDEDRAGNGSPRH